MKQNEWYDAKTVSRFVVHFEANRNGVTSLPSRHATLTEAMDTAMHHVGEKLDGADCTDLVVEDGIIQLNIGNLPLARIVAEGYDLDPSDLIE